MLIIFLFSFFFFYINLWIKYNADPSIPVIDGRTPLHYAAHNGNSDIVKLILEARQKPAAELWDDDPLFMVNKAKCSALHESTIMGDLESTKLLVEAGSGNYINTLCHYNYKIII